MSEAISDLGGFDFSEGVQFGPAAFALVPKIVDATESTLITDATDTIPGELPYTKAKHQQPGVGATQQSSENDTKVVSGERITLLTEDPQLKDQARLLVATVYIKHGYVKETDLTAEGFIGNHLDPHVQDSKYYIRKIETTNTIVTTGRLIQKADLSEYPAVKEFGIDTAKLSAIDPDPAHFREVSALAKASKIGHRDDVLHVYAGMLKDSLDSDAPYWLMSVDNKLVHTLHQLFGKKSFVQLGPAQFMMGSDTTPLLLDIEKAIGLFNKRFIPKHIKDIFAQGLRGIDESKLEASTVKTLKKHGVIDKTEADKKADKLEGRANIGLYAYTLGRGALAGTMGLSPTEAAIFWSLDAGGVWPYVRGLRNAGSKYSTKTETVAGYAMAGTAFMAPYAYLMVERGVAEGGVQAAGIFGVTAAITGTVKKVRERLRQKSPKSDQNSTE